MKLSKRLLEVSQYIEDNSNIIDVGCDHALLDIYLFKNKKNIKLIASDIKEGPLDQAKKNITKYNCNIKIKQGFGISTIEDDIDTVVITGMGGDTIIDILVKDKDKLDNVNTLILSPQSEWEKVRKEVCNLGYKITDEKIIIDGKYYLIMKCKKGSSNYSINELKYGPILLKNKSKEFIDYHTNLLNEEVKVLSKIPFYKLTLRLIQKNKIKELRDILKERQ